MGGRRIMSGRMRQGGGGRIRRSLSVVPFALLIGILSACGGGGSAPSTGNNAGGNTGSSANSGVSLSLSTTTVTETATVGQSAPVANVLAYANGLATGREIYLNGRYSENGIASLSAGTGTSPITVSIQFKSPATLGPGTYQDTISLSGCYDQACTQQVTGSPQSVQ